jgi:hypothetical protein
MSAHPLDPARSRPRRRVALIALAAVAGLALLLVAHVILPPGS